jgi:KDO2-lipid IV(A) lauroyltransferase
VAFLTAEEVRRWSRTFRLIRNLTEFMGTLLALGIFRILPVDMASSLGGKIGRSLGPLLPVSQRARHNLKMAFPDKTAEEIAHIVGGMWENFGRTAAEYPHLRRLRCYEAAGRVEVQGTEILDRIEDSGEPHIFFSGHFANLELEGTSVTGRNMPLTIVYRAANNPLVNYLFLQIRKHGIGAAFVPKGKTGARELIAALGEGRHVGLLVDQKMNDGISVPFFGRDAMTAPALAQLALKSDRPVIPLQIERLEGASFRIIIHPALEIQKTGDRESDVYNVMVQVNKTLESWIRQRPEQWFWLHNRWSD